MSVRTRGARSGDQAVDSRAMSRTSATNDRYSPGALVPEMRSVSMLIAASAMASWSGAIELSEGVRNASAQDAVDL